MDISCCFYGLIETFINWSNVFPVLCRCVIIIYSYTASSWITKAQLFFSRHDLFILLWAPERCIWLKNVQHFLQGGHSLRPLYRVGPRSHHHSVSTPHSNFQWKTCIQIENLLITPKFLLTIISTNRVRIQN